MRVLVVEDEPQLALRVEQALEAAGFAVDVAYDGEEAWFLGDTEPYDAVVLDLGLPRLDGVSVLRRWREAGRTFPVLVLTARSRWSEKAQAFDSGADDYLTKPFEMDEVVYRIRALIRRAAGHASPEIVCGPVRIDTGSARVWVDDQKVALTAQEFRILNFFMHRQGRIISQAQLLDHIYAMDSDRDPNTIEVYVARLRRKLGRESIKTLRGLGYRFG